MQFNLFLNFILFPGLRNDDQTNTDPVAWSMTPNIPGNLNLSATTFCHKIKIYILLTFCYTFPLISVLRIWYNIKLEKNLSLKTGIGIFSCYKNFLLVAVSAFVHSFHSSLIEIAGNFCWIFDLRAFSRDFIKLWRPLLCEKTWAWIWQTNYISQDLWARFKNCFWSEEINLDDISLPKQLFSQAMMILHCGLSCENLSYRKT